jgi:hypothetical protein
MTRRLPFGSSAAAAANTTARGARSATRERRLMGSRRVRWCGRFVPPSNGLGVQLHGTERSPCWQVATESTASAGHRPRRPTVWRFRCGRGPDAALRRLGCAPESTTDRNRQARGRRLQGLVRQRAYPCCGIASAMLVQGALKLTKICAAGVVSGSESRVPRRSLTSPGLDEMSLMRGAPQRVQKHRN